VQPDPLQDRNVEKLHYGSSEFEPHPKGWSEPKEIITCKTIKRNEKYVAEAHRMR